MNEPPNGDNYGGPVFNGGVSGAQFAWNNDKVTQTQQNDSAVAAGFEELTQLVTDLLRHLPQSGLPDQDRADADAAAREVLATISRPEPPEPGRLRRAIATLKGALAPVASGVVTGTAVGAQEWARTAIEGLTGIV